MPPGLRDRPRIINLSRPAPYASMAVQIREETDEEQPMGRGVCVL